ncbi:hypothetical protein B0T25DRAFT_548765 [Lasiosphaeria hispida]|uniref:Uncharacterized protein n=1 Tax=Lasiosphaeria hispida TaxID=260671 RepID=A0AAJ0HF93_9PEZI|nr:hypothetical protein B0T25DRAFT_548765 [Lasiosphaeria hispida]
MHEHQQGRSVSNGSQVVGPEIQVKPAIDPQFGDLLPLPPSKPGSPSLSLDEEFPELPGSRPDTPPEERVRARTHTRNRSSIAETPKTPSRTAVPIQFRLGRGSVPPSSALSSPAMVVGGSEALPLVMLPARSRSRPKAWDGREIKPLYLLETTRPGFLGSEYTQEQDLELPPCDPPPRESTVPEYEDGLIDKDVLSETRQREITETRASTSKPVVEQDEAAAPARSGRKRKKAKKAKKSRPEALDSKWEDEDAFKKPEAESSSVDATVLTVLATDDTWEPALEPRKKGKKKKRLGSSPGTGLTEPSAEPGRVAEIAQAETQTPDALQKPKSAEVAESQPSAQKEPLVVQEDAWLELTSSGKKWRTDEDKTKRHGQQDYSNTRRKKMWLSGLSMWAQEYGLNISQRLFGRGESHPIADLRGMAYGEFFAEANQPGSPELRSQPLALFAADRQIPPPAVTKGVRPPPSLRNPDSGRGAGAAALPQPSAPTANPPGGFEALLRAKVFKPQVGLLTYLPEPIWVSSGTGAHCLFSKPEALHPRSLLPQGKFVAERDSITRDAIKEIELGFGITASGFGVEVHSKGLLSLLKPYQWIDMWRGLPRDMYVCNHLLGLGDDPSNTSDMGRLHEVEDELMSSVKYQLGESDYVTVITYSKAVRSGAITLFRASFDQGCAVARLDLVARFKDIPKKICQILRNQGNPNRYELKRAGRRVTCRVDGGLPPSRPAVVLGEEEWTNIGGGWRKALHIILHDDSPPREGLVATIPQMLALLHLRFRFIDCVPSTPIFCFEPPLSGRAGDFPVRVQRGIKLLGPPSGASHVVNAGTITVLFSRESPWVKEELFWA